MDRLGIGHLLNDPVHLARMALVWAMMSWTSRMWRGRSLGLSWWVGGHTVVPPGMPLATVTVVVHDTFHTKTSNIQFLTITKSNSTTETLLKTGFGSKVLKGERKVCKLTSGVILTPLVVKPFCFIHLVD